MVCPHCNKVIIVKLMKDSNVTPAVKSAPRASTDTGDLESLLDAINEDRLEGKAADFVAEIRERFAKYKSKTMMTEKQLA